MKNYIEEKEARNLIKSKSQCSGRKNLALYKKIQQKVLDSKFLEKKSYRADDLFDLFGK